MRKRMINFILIAVLVYLGLLVYLYLNQRKMIFFPDTAMPPVVEGVEVVNVTTSDGLKLESWLIAPADETKPILLLFHGNAGNYSHRVHKAVPLMKDGYGMLLAEYRGYGGNPGKVGEQGFYNDARAYVEFLKQRKNPIVLYGESIGTGVAVKMATEYDVAGLILESPYTSVTEVAQSLYPVVPVSLLLQDKFPSIDIIKNVKAPLLIIHGALDSTIPIRFGRALFDAANEPKTFITLDSAGHNDLADHGSALHILQFLSKIGPPQSGASKE